MKKKQKKIKWISFAEHKAQMMKDPDFKKAYDDLDLEFKLISAMIDQRNKKKITQKQLAQQIGTKQSAIARFETGNANPRLSFMKKLTRALDLQLTVRSR